MQTLRIAMAQINPTVGDLEGNKERIIGFIGQARSMGADLITFPELALCGYPPEDLLLNPGFIRANHKCLEEIIEASEGITAIVGFPDGEEDIYNAAAIIHDGSLAGVYHKIYLPNYGVFDENRYFQGGSEYLVFEFGGVTIGVNICEDIWHPGGPTEAQVLGGDAQLIVNISSSPYYAGKGKFRERMLATRAADNVVMVAFTNLVGGQDELVFDGQSMIFDARGELLVRGRQFEEDLVLADLELGSVFRDRLHDPRRRQKQMAFKGEAAKVRRIKLGSLGEKEKRPLVKRKMEALSREAEIYQALVLGLRDYVWKNGFEKAIVAISGGIDSALTAAIAVDALGREEVVGLSMPSEYSSPEGQADAKVLADNLGIKLLGLPISEVFQAHLQLLSGAFENREADVTEENLQARIRGNIIMALSNKFGWLPLATGNKSEISVGYCTLYGDMVGGFAVIKDVPKMLVYELARYRNAKEGRDLIPESILKREPSAELRPGQKDADALPAYPTLDPILEAYVENDMSFEEIVALGFEEETVARVLEMVDRSEYKRRQGAPGIKITPRAFGRDRRFPITNKFRSGRSLAE